LRISSPSAVFTIRPRADVRTASVTAPGANACRVTTGPGRIASTVPFASTAAQPPVCAETATTRSSATSVSVRDPFGDRETIVRPEAYGSMRSQGRPRTIGAGPSTSAAAKPIRRAFAVRLFVQSDHSRMLPPV
jgi:hypothetical protein